MNAKTFKIIKSSYKFIYFSVFALVVISAIYIIATDYDITVPYRAGKFIAYISLFFFTLTILPGMLRRFGVKSRLFVTTLTALKRQNGDTMFLFAFLHYAVIKLFPVIASNSFPPVFLLYELIGLIALWLTFLLYVTSNDYSVRKLKKFWKTLHYLIYIIIWLIFLHVALVKINVVTVFVGILATFETLSLIYYYLIKKKP